MPAGARKPLSGFVLTGGRSSRYGSNKAFALLDGVSLVDRALTALTEIGCVPQLVAKDSAPYRELGVTIVDNEGPQRGPVAGWKAALEAAPMEWVFVLSVDMPYVNADVLRALIPEAFPDSPQAFCFVHPGRTRQPFPGLYHRALAREAESLGPAPAMYALLRCFTVNEVTLPGNPDRVLQNINRPADFR